MARFLVALLLMLGLGAVVFDTANDLDRRRRGEPRAVADPPAQVSYAEGGSGFPPPNP